VRLLLDTHIWIWSHHEPDRLSTRVAAALVDERNELWLSPISLWEFLVLVQKGKLGVPGAPDAKAWIDEALRRAPMQEAAMTYQVAVRSRFIELGHDDPADRFLAATAEVYDLVLVTADKQLVRGKGFQVLANR
jgi:PIN domain nuclease of toxin-antitoxin system